PWDAPWYGLLAKRGLLGGEALAEVLAGDESGEGLGVQVNAQGELLADLAVVEYRRVAGLEPMEPHQGERRGEIAGRRLVEVEGRMDGKARGVLLLAREEESVPNRNLGDTAGPLFIN